jgi:hypothetical protein
MEKSNQYLGVEGACKQFVSNDVLKSLEAAKIKKMERTKEAVKKARRKALCGLTLYGTLPCIVDDITRQALPFEMSGVVDRLVQTAKETGLPVHIDIRLIPESDGE